MCVLFCGREGDTWWHHWPPIPVRVDRQNGTLACAEKFAGTPEAGRMHLEVGALNGYVSKGTPRNGWFAFWAFKRQARGVRPFEKPANW